MATERWRQILRLMDEAYEDYVNGMVALRKRVIGDMRRKVKDSSALDRSRAGSNSTPASKGR